MQASKHTCVHAHMQTESSDNREHTHGQGYHVTLYRGLVILRHSINREKNIKEILDSYRDSLVGKPSRQLETKKGRERRQNGAERGRRKMKLVSERERVGNHKCTCLLSGSLHANPQQKPNKCSSFKETDINNKRGISYN